MASMQVLRKQAREAGISAAQIRKASTADELNALMANGSAPVKKAVKKTTAVARRGRPKGTTTVKPKPAAAKRAVGRPKGSGTKPPAAKAAKRASAATGNGDGRHVLGSIDYSEHPDWNPRKDSPPDRIIRAARKFRGNREKIYDSLVDSVWDFTGKVKTNGDKRTIVEAKAMLKYRIAATVWQFAIKTGQHVKAGKRAAYGSVNPKVYVPGYGGRASVTAPKSKRPKVQAVAKASAPVKRGRPAKAAEPVAKKRGRPAKKS